MGKKSRKKRHRKEWVRATPDDVISYGPLRIERYGRFIRYSNESTDKQHAAFLERTREVHQRIHSELEEKVQALQTLVGAFDPVELMHRAAYELLPLFMKYRSESEFGPEESFYLPTVEYIQYLIARTKPGESGKTPSEEEWGRFWDQALEVMKLTQQWLMTRKTLSNPPSETDELRFMLDGRRLMIRVQRYPIFHRVYLESSLEPYGQWIKEVHGVGTEDIIEGLGTINEYLRTGVIDRYRAVHEAIDAVSKKLRAQGYSVNPGATPEEVERTRAALEADEFRHLHEDVQEKARLTFTSAIFDITDLTSLPTSFLSLLSVQPGESILNALTGPDGDDLSPLSTSILHYKPFVEVSGRFYAFYHSGFEDRVAEIIEADLYEKHSDRQISEMASRRNDRLESEAVELLSSVLNPDFVHRNVYYPNPDDAGNLTELDALLGIDDILFLVEAKAGGFSEAASRGAPKSLEKELSDLIVEGQRQSERAERYIRSDEEVEFYNDTGKEVVHSIKRSEVRKIVRVVVTREDLGWVGARISVLSILDPKLSESAPWHVSIDDLRVVADLFQGNDIGFIHYLEQRLQASAQTELSQHDELEHIGLYNKVNAYYKSPVQGMHRISHDASYMVDIDHYFMDKGVGESPPVPRQELGPKLRAFIDALGSSRLSHRYEFASGILSLASDGRAEFVRGLDALDEGFAQGRVRTFRMPFIKFGFGLTVTRVSGRHWDEELPRSAVQMEQGGCGQWLVSQLAPESSYKVVKIEKVLLGRFSVDELKSARVHLEERAQGAIHASEPGRNDPCPCGSGKKFKKCHGR